MGGILMVFKVRNICAVDLTEEGDIKYSIRMIITHDNKLYMEVKDNSQSKEYEYAKLSTGGLSRPFEETNKAHSKNLNIGYMGDIDLTLINDNIKTIKEKIYHRLTKKDDTIHITRKTKIIISYYNPKRIALGNKEYILL